MVERYAGLTFAQWQDSSSHQGRQRAWREAERPCLHQILLAGLGRFLAIALGALPAGLPTESLTVTALERPLSCTDHFVIDCDAQVTWPSLARTALVYALVFFSLLRVAQSVLCL